MANFIFALWIAFMPMIQSFSDLIGLSEAITGSCLIITVQISLFGIVYIGYLTAKLMSVHNKKDLLITFLIKFKKPLPILVLGLVLSMLISSCVNGLNAYSLVYIGYFMIFICVYNLTKEQIKVFVKIILFVVGYSCMLGFIDPTGSFIPGFRAESINTSLHFWNPNYAGYIIAVCIILTVLQLKNTNKIKDYIHFGILFCIFSLQLYLNGSFVPITAAYATIFVLIIYSWIREKKFQRTMVILFTLLIPFAFVVDAMPNVNKYRTSKVNYFIECVAVLDNFAGTNLLEKVSDVDRVNGADGWNRDELLSGAIDKVKPKSENDGVKRLFWGYGAGYTTAVRPHNNYIGILVDYGIFTLLFYSAIIVYFFVRFFRTKKSQGTIMFAFAMFTFLLMSFFGSIIDFWYWLFIACFAMGFKTMKIQNENVNLVSNENNDKKTNESKNKILLNNE